MEVKFFFRTWIIFFGFFTIIGFIVLLLFDILLGTLVMVWKVFEYLWPEIILHALYRGLYFGFIGGLAAAFFFPGIKMSITFDNKKRFLKKLNFYIFQIRYARKLKTKNKVIYKPTSRLGFLVGNISTQIGEKKALIIGPSLQVKKLQNWMINY